MSTDKKKALLERETNRRLSVGSNVSTLLYSWLVLGNGAGLYFILSNVADNKLREGVPYDWAYLAFLIGAATAFFSLVLVLWINDRARSLLEQMSFDVDLTTDEAKARMKKSQKSMSGLGLPENFAWFLGVVSSLSLLAGLTVPLKFGSMSANGQPNLILPQSAPAAPTPDEVVSPPAEPATESETNQQ